METNQISAIQIAEDLEKEFHGTADNIQEAGYGVGDGGILSPSDPPPTQVDNDERPTYDTDILLDDAPKKKKSLSKLVKPKNAVNLVDWVVPAVIVFIVEKFNYQLSKKDLQLDKEEKELLQPFVEDFLEAVEIDLSNPYINLAVGLTIVYGIKVIDAKPKKRTGKDVEDIDEETLTNAAKFEQEYNIYIEDIINTEKAKGRLSAMKWLADNEPEKIKSLMAKWEFNDDKYLRYSKIYLKELNEKKYSAFGL